MNLAHIFARRGRRVWPAWGLPILALLVCECLSGAAFSMVNPFIPLYLAELGENRAGVVAWTGAVFAVAYLIQIVAFPFWGAISDRRGRKALVAFALASAAVVFFVLALAQQAWQVFALRTLQAAVGAPSVPLALASSLLPPARLTTGLGMLQTSSFLGQSFGPLLGSLAATRFGLRGAFMVAVAGLLATGALVWFLARKPRRATSDAVVRMSLRERLAVGWRVPVVRATLAAMLGYQLAYSVSWFLLPVHITKIVGTLGAPPAIGIVPLANSVGIAVGANVLGWVAGRAGARCVAVVALLAAGAMTLPQVWADNALAFTLTRFGLGLCAGGVLPSMRASLGGPMAGPGSTANLGAIYGLAQSATAAGVALGAPFGLLGFFRVVAETFLGIVRPAPDPFRKRADANLVHAEEDLLDN
jgi:DHA1 family multidrug resistance protein-like MFS transporter